MSAYPVEMSEIRSFCSNFRGLCFGTGGSWPSIYWSERSVCAALGCRQKRRWPLFLVIIPLLGVLTTVVKIPEGVVIRFQIFAWAPK